MTDKNSRLIGHFSIKAERFFCGSGAYFLNVKNFFGFSVSF